MNDVEGFSIAGLIIIAAIFLFGFGFGIGKRNVENQAIEKGYAEYNRKTGEWQWVEKDKLLKREREKKLKGNDDG